MKKVSLITVLLCLGVLASGCAKETSRTSETTNVQSIENEESSENSDNILNDEMAEIAGEITVSCYDSGVYRLYLEDAAKLFEQKYPGTKVHIESFSEAPQIYYSDVGIVDAVVNKDNPQERADYISKVSTALMSGQGADILALDVLPVYKYIETGQLENLKDYMDNDADFDLSDYQQNIFKALEVRDGLWILPLDYSFEYYAYDSTLITEAKGIEFGTNQSFTTNQLIELGRGFFDGTHQMIAAPAYLQRGNGDLFSRLFRENYRSFIDLENKTANFNDGTFKELITGVKELADHGYIGPAVEHEINPSDLLEAASANPTERFQFKPKNQVCLFQQVDSNDGVIVMATTSGVGKGIEDDDQIAGICAEENGIIPFTYDMGLGINSNSKNKQTAWAFMKMMISYDAQRSYHMLASTFPIHNQARTDKAKELYRLLLDEKVGGEFDESQQKVLDAYFDAVKEISEQINGYTFRETMIQDMVVKEMWYFFEGSKTADEVCEILQNRIDLYLNE